MSYSPQRLPQRRTDLPFRDGQTRSVLDDPEGGSRYVLNATARAVWELCDGSTTLEELTEAICRVFSVPRHQAEVEVGVAVDELAQAGLVTWERPEEVRPR